MIYYATDSNTRTTTYSIFMFSAVVVQSFLALIFKFLNSQLFFFLDVSSVSAFTIFAISFIIYDKYIWNRKYKWIYFSTVPDFSGEWVGYIEERQEFTKHGNTFTKKTEELIAVQLHVNQTFRKISVSLKSMATRHTTKSRESECTTAGVSSEDSKRPKLIYTWIRSDLAGSGEFIRRTEGEKFFLDGHYQSNYPRSGSIRLVQRRPSDRWYCGQIRKIESKGQQPYIGIHIPEQALLPALESMKQFLDERAYGQYRQKQNTRDSGGFHMTILDPQEYSSSDQTELAEVEKYLDETFLWMRLVGLGKQSFCDDETYYCVIECEGAQKIRHKCGLGNRDMHATLGFKSTDLHDVPKGTNTVVASL
jgi:hypothetical protein